MSPGRSLSEDERELILTLRSEANAVKEAFTRYAFQSLALSAAGLGLIIKYQPEEPLVGLAAFPVIMIVLAVARMGVSKYATANRHNGYELHLHRTSKLPDSASWSSNMREIGWEEAMRAWRIVQAMTFAHVYETGTWKRNIMRPEFQAQRSSRADLFWFDIGTLLSAVPVPSGVPAPRWHSGMYLQTVLRILHGVAFVLLLPVVLVPIQLMTNSWFGERSSTSTAEIVAAWIAFAIGLVGVITRERQVDCRRRVLESGLLSIHSCAIMWHAVVTAHHRAMAALKVHQGPAAGLRGYSAELAKQGVDLNQDVLNIHMWIHDLEAFRRGAGGVARPSDASDEIPPALSQRIQGLVADQPVELPAVPEVGLDDLAGDVRIPREARTEPGQRRE